MQNTIMAWENKTAFSKESSNSFTQQSLKKVSTHSIFPIVPGFFSPYFDLALQSSSSFRVRSTYVRLPFAFCYLCLHLTPVLKIPDHPPNFFSSLLLLIYHFLISSGLRKIEIRINLLGLVFPAFYWMFGLERKFQGWSDKVSAAPKKESATKSWPTSMSETFMLHKFLTQTS